MSTLTKSDPLGALRPSMPAGALSALTSAPGLESLLLVLDGSGSMSGDPWEALVQAVGELCRRSSQANCRLGLVIFSDKADLYVPFTEDFERVVSKMPQEAPLGGTAVREALGLACKLEWPCRRRRLVLLSDGMPTTGDPIPAGKVLAESGVVIDTVACGDGADRETLAELARVGGGRFVDCGSVGELVRAFLQLETKVRGLLR